MGRKRAAAIPAWLFGGANADAARSARAILYVTNSAGNDVTLVDVATHRAIGSIEIGPTPHGIEASPDGSRVYVSGETDDDVVAIDTATSSVLWKAPIGDRPNHIALSADGRYVYAPIRSADYADVVDTQSGKKVKSITIPKALRGLFGRQRPLLSLLSARTPGSLPMSWLKLFCVRSTITPKELTRAMTELSSS